MTEKVADSLVTESKAGERQELITAQIEHAQKWRLANGWTIPTTVITSEADVMLAQYRLASTPAQAQAWEIQVCKHCNVAIIFEPVAKKWTHHTATASYRMCRHGEELQTATAEPAALAQPQGVVATRETDFSKLPLHMQSHQTGGDTNCLPTCPVCTATAQAVAPACQFGCNDVMVNTDCPNHKSVAPEPPRNELSAYDDIIAINAEIPVKPAAVAPPEGRERERNMPDKDLRMLAKDAAARIRQLGGKVEGDQQEDWSIILDAIKTALAAHNGDSK